MKKQIEEMAKHIPARMFVIDVSQNCVYVDEYHRKLIAEYLYNAGYRKASEVAREIFEEIESCKWSETQYGDRTLCFEINSEKYAELKKKYRKRRHRMKVYIVFTEKGTIYSVCKSKTDANKDKANLERRYENATIKEFNVQ